MRRPLRDSFVTVLALSAALAAPASSRGQDARQDLLTAGRVAAASGDHAAAYRAFRRAYDPLADDPTVLAALASAAIAGGELPRFRALLDSVVGSGTGHRHALEYWSALALESGDEPAAVASELDAYLAARPRDVEAYEGFVRVLIAHRAPAEALSLLERAAARGAPPEAIAVPRGDARADLGDGAGAVEDYAAAIVVGDERGIERVRALLAAWPSGSTPMAAVAPLERDRDRAERQARARLVELAAEARVAAGQGEEALTELRSVELNRSERATALRAMASRALARGELGFAEQAIEELEQLGPPQSDPRDHLLRREIEVARRGGSRAGAGSPGDPRLVRGDLALAHGQPDSAIAAYAAMVDGLGAVGGSVALEALGRIRLVRALVAARVSATFLAGVGAALSEEGEPLRKAARLDSLAGSVALSTSIPASALLTGLAAEWRGRAGEPARASAVLEKAAVTAGDEAPALLLAAGRWAAAAQDTDRAHALWRRVVERHDLTPYALEARRLLAERSGEGR